jgi:hypothetical protein
MAKDYAAIARQRIVKSGSTPREPRFLIYGRNKKGKTHFCATAPDVLILDPEDGTKYESDKDVWHIGTWDDVNEALSYLRLGKHKYKWVAVDGMTRVANMALRFVMRQAQERALDQQPVQIQIQHYGRAGEMVKTMLHTLHSLRNMGVILTAQERMVEVAELDDVDDDDATPASYQFVPDVPKGARSALNAIVDLTGRIYVVKGEFSRRVRRDGKVVEEEYTRERRLLIGPEEMYETGYRSEHVLPDFIVNPTVPRVVKAMREGIKS